MKDQATRDKYKLIWKLRNKGEYPPCYNCENWNPHQKDRIHRGEYFCQIKKTERQECELVNDWAEKKRIILLDNS